MEVSIKPEHRSLLAEEERRVMRRSETAPCLFFISCASDKDAPHGALSSFSLSSLATPFREASDNRRSELKYKITGAKPQQMYEKSVFSSVFVGQIETFENHRKVVVEHIFASTYTESQRKAIHSLRLFVIFVMVFKKFSTNGFSKTFKGLRLAIGCPEQILD